MDNFNAADVWAIISGVAAAVILIANAVEKIIAAVKAAKAPNAAQDERLDNLEKWRDEVDRRLLNGNAHFDMIDEGNRVTQRALLALLNHGLDGNNVSQMEDAKKEIENYLINR